MRAPWLLRYDLVLQEGSPFGARIFLAQLVEGEPDVVTFVSFFRYPWLKSSEYLKLEAELFVSEHQCSMANVITAWLLTILRLDLQATHPIGIDHKLL